MVHFQIHNAFELPAIKNIKKDQTYGSNSQRPIREETLYGRLSVLVGLKPIKKLFDMGKVLVIMIDTVHRTKHKRLKSDSWFLR